VHAGFNPYLVGISAQPCPWLDSVSVVWRDTPTPYGPVFLVLAGLAAAFGSQLAALISFRVLAVLGVVAIAACLPVLARRVGAPVDRALWLVLCCPLVPVHLIGGGHNDALTVALMVAGFAVLAAPRPSWAVLAAGGALLGLAVSIKITIGVVLPFGALLAVGGLRNAGWSGLLRRGGVVVGAALAVLVATSFASGLGLGWLTALSGAGESVNWSSPPTAVGLAVEAAGRWFGADLTVVPAVRAVALVLLGVSLLVILWRFRDRDPLVGGGLALLTVIFFAPITQPWYLIWPLALFAVGTAQARWLAGTIVVAMTTILPEGTGVFRPLGVPLSFAMIVLIGWVLYRSVTWLRGRELVAS
jgi:alpha-1,6-mannosyltransferase